MDYFQVFFDINKLIRKGNTPSNHVYAIDGFKAQSHDRVNAVPTVKEKELRSSFNDLLAIGHLMITSRIKKNGVGFTVFIIY